MSRHIPIDELKALGHSVVQVTHIGGIANPESRVAAETMAAPAIEFVGRKPKWGRGSATHLEPEQPPVGGVLSRGWRKLWESVGGSDQLGKSPGNNDHQRHRGSGTDREGWGRK